MFAISGLLKPMNIMLTRERKGEERGKKQCCLNVNFVCVHFVTGS